MSKINIITGKVVSFAIKIALKKFLKLFNEEFLNNIGIQTIVFKNSYDMEKRDIQAKSSGNTIFVKPEGSAQDIYSDLIHETGHFFLKYIEDFSLFDEVVIDFENKRLQLFNLLKENGYNVYVEDFLNIKYNSKFDNMLLNEIGYSKLKEMTGVSNPYLFTSLEEYFSVLFEMFYNGKEKQVADISQPVYKILDEMENGGWFEED